MARQHGVDDRALDADAAAVNQTDLAQAARVSRDDVLLDDGGDVPRHERMQIKRVLDRDRNRLVLDDTASSAVTRNMGGPDMAL